MIQGRDIQFFDPKFVIPEINQIMAELFGKSNGLANQYRSNSLNPDGSSSVQSVDRWFKLLKNSDLREKSLLYFTGHGGKVNLKNFLILQYIFGTTRKSAYPNSLGKLKLFLNKNRLFLSWFNAIVVVSQMLSLKKEIRKKNLLKGRLLDFFYPTKPCSSRLHA